MAVQAKLDELIRSGRAKNDFAGLEHLTAAEIEEVLGKRSLPPKRRRAKRAIGHSKPNWL
ncbi:conserved hypothetical protein [Mesorhizobium sp. ORS 3359]|nr:conserved hypothetical protein [Mesorhizobium sp. ORS 3359]